MGGAPGGMGPLDDSSSSKGCTPGPNWDTKETGLKKIHYEVQKLNEEANRNPLPTGAIYERVKNICGYLAGCLNVTDDGAGQGAGNLKEIAERLKNYIHGGNPDGMGVSEDALQLSMEAETRWGDG